MAGSVDQPTVLSKWHCLYSTDKHILFNRQTHCLANALYSTGKHTVWQMHCLYSTGKRVVCIEQVNVLFGKCIVYIQQANTLLVFNRQMHCLANVLFVLNRQMHCLYWTGKCVVCIEQANALFVFNRQTHCLYWTGKLWETKSRTCLMKFSWPNVMLTWVCGGSTTSTRYR